MHDANEAALVSNCWMKPRGSWNWAETCHIVFCFHRLCSISVR